MLFLKYLIQTMLQLKSRVLSFPSLQSRFSSYFGGPCVKFGQCLHDRLFKDKGLVDEEMFIKQMKTLSSLSGNQLQVDIK